MQNSTCPVCYNRGLKRSMKAIQINLEEAVWTCESEDCIWPLMYDQLIYIPRKVGKVWSCYWDQFKPTIIKQESIPMPCELSLYTPPETPGDEEESKFQIGSVVGDHNYSKGMENPKEEIKEEAPAVTKSQHSKESQQYEKFNFNSILGSNDLESLLEEYLTGHENDFNNPDISDNWLNALLS